jgi:hypothetical protein
MNHIVIKLSILVMLMLGKLNASNQVNAEETQHGYNPHFACVFFFPGQAPSHVFKVPARMQTAESPLISLFPTRASVDGGEVTILTTIDLYKSRYADGTYADATADDRSTIWRKINECHPDFDGSENLEHLPIKYAICLSGTDLTFAPYILRIGIRIHSLILKSSVLDLSRILANEDALLVEISASQ